MGKKLTDVIGFGSHGLNPDDIRLTPIAVRDISGESLVVLLHETAVPGWILAVTAPVSKKLFPHSGAWWVAVFIVWLGGLAGMFLYVLRSLVQRIRMSVELEASQRDLENRVEQRTAEITKTNRKLLDEMRAREQIQESLAESERRYREFAEFLPQMVFELDVEGRVTFLNRSGLAAAGFDRDGLIEGLRALHLVRSEDHEEMHEQYRRIKKGNAVGPAEFLVQKKNGGSFHVVAYAAPISREGRVIGIRGIAMDVSDLKAVQRELEISRASFSDIVDGIAEGIIVLNPAGKLMYANGSAYAMLGVSKGEALSEQDEMRFFDLLGSSPPSIIRAGGEEGIGETRKSEGQWLGAPAVIVTVRDVTERQKAEEELTTERLQLLSLFDSINHPIVVTDFDTYEVLFLNKEAIDMFGVEAWGGLCWKELRKQSGPCGFCPNERVRDLDGESYRWEKLDDASGRTHIMMDRLIKWRDGRDAKFQLAVDVTDLKQAEDALRASERRYRNLIEAAPVGVAIIKAGAIVYANQTLLTIAGFSNPDDFLGKPFQQYSAAEWLRSDLEMVRRVLAGEAVVSPHETVMEKADGSRSNLLIWPTLIDFEGGPSVLAFVIDATTETILRSQLLQAQKMEAVGTLAGGIAHDFNNILTVIQGYSEILMVDLDPKCGLCKDLNIIHDAGKRGAELVRRILTFSRKSETGARPLKLNHAVKQASELLKSTISKMIKIDLRLAEDLSVINADPVRIEQVIFNLAVNAQHAMPKGGVLTLTTQNVFLDEDYARINHEVTPGDYALFTCSDTGQGIPRNIIDRIFEPFFSTKAKGEGTGLGLAMVFGIVQHHGGHIRCYSEPGIGTCFKVYFPAMEESAYSGSDIPNEHPPTGSETILLVEDEDHILGLLRRILTRAGYTTLAAYNGLDALSIYRSEGHRVSLVMSDLFMPEMGGGQCLEELLRINPEVKVIITSGFLTEVQANDILAAGAKAFLPKPHLRNEVLTVVRRVLDS